MKYPDGPPGPYYGEPLPMSFVGTLFTILAYDVLKWALFRVFA